MPTKTSGRYTIDDPTICHGEPAFSGTRIMAHGCAGQVESGMAYEAIIEEWRGALERGAIAKSPFAWHVRRWSLMHPGWFRRWHHHDE